jgi:hypothetical protein
MSGSWDVEMLGGWDIVKPMNCLDEMCRALGHTSTANDKPVFLCCRISQLLNFSTSFIKSKDL